MKDNTLYQEGDDIYSIYFSDKGSLGFVHKKYNNVKYVYLDIGTYFGVIDIVYSIYTQDIELDRWINSKDKMTRNFTCLADEDSTLLALNISDLSKMKNEFQDTYEQIFSGAYEQLQKVMLLKLYTLCDCKKQLKEYMDTMKMRLLNGKLFQAKLGAKVEEDKPEEPKEFEINCFSYQDLYKVRYEALKNHIFSKQTIDNQDQKDIKKEMNKIIKTG